MTEPGAITARTVVVFLVATWPRRLVLGLLLLAPVLVAASGGFEQNDPPPREAAPGVATDTGAYLVVPRSFFVSEHVDAGSLDDGYRWVGAVAQITNQGAEPISVAFSDPTFELPAEVPNDSFVNPHEVLRLDTGTRLGSAQPGVTYDVALLWQTTGLEDPPAELELTMNQTAWTRWTIEAGLYTWRSTPHAFTVELPLDAAPESILVEEDE